MTVKQLHEKPYGSKSKFQNIPVALRFENLHERYTAQKELPRGFNIELTNRCNYNCPMCAKSLKEENLLDLDFDIIKKIVKEFHNKPLYLPLFKRGESLLRSDLEQIVDFIKSENEDNYIVLSTNGSFLKEDKYTPVKKIDRINISMLTTDSALYHKLTGASGKQFNQCIENIIELSQAMVEGPEVAVMFMAIDENMPFKDKFYSFWSQHNVSIYEQFCIDWGTYNFRKGKRKIPERFPCMHLWCYPTVNIDATVSICCNDYYGMYTVGDLKKDSFRDIWHGEEMDRVRSLHLEKRWSEIELCRNCLGWSYQENPFAYDKNTKRFRFIFEY